MIPQHKTVLRQGRVPIPQSRDLQEGIQKEYQEHAEQEWSDLEWSGVTLEWKEVDNKSGETTLASARALCLNLLLRVVAYFRRTELLPGVQERSGILIRVRIEHVKNVNLRTKELGCN